jgi:hypothetical protein
MQQIMEAPERRLNSRRSSMLIGIRRQSYGRRLLEINSFLEELSKSWEVTEKASWQKIFSHKGMLALYVAVATLLLFSSKMLHKNVLANQTIPRTSLSASYDWAGFHRIGPLSP